MGINPWKLLTLNTLLQNQQNVASQLLIFGYQKEKPIKIGPKFKHTKTNNFSRFSGGFRLPFLYLNFDQNLIHKNLSFTSKYTFCAKIKVSCYTSVTGNEKMF